MSYFKDLKSPYLIAEIGINHNGDMTIARKLIDLAYACGWDCVKFQKRDPEICFSSKEKSAMKDTPWGKMTYLEYKNKLEFGEQQYRYIERYCGDKYIDWTVSVWDLNSVDFISRYKSIPFIKIPSAKLTDSELLTASCRLDMPIMLSTGMSTIEEIDTAVDILRKNSVDWMLLHCTSSYPAKADEINLNVMNTFKKRYECEVGYSGHELGLEASTMAAVMGAKVIERHVTLDHRLWGPDQTSSIQPHAMDMFSKRVKGLDIYMGDGNKVVYESELPCKKKLRDNLKDA